MIFVGMAGGGFRSSWFLYILREEFLYIFIYFFCSASRGVESEASRYFQKPFKEFADPFSASPSSCPFLLWSPSLSAPFAFFFFLLSKACGCNIYCCFRTETVPTGLKEYSSRLRSQTRPKAAGFFFFILFLGRGRGGEKRSSFSGGSRRIQVV
jgi:hypothetical protein